MIPIEQQGGREGKVCTCVMCAFYSPPKDQTREGECRINPPIAWGESTDGFWPRIPSDGWCGEWQSVDLGPERKSA